MRRLWCLLAALVPLVSLPAVAQQWPTKTVRAVVPLSAGSAVDIVPRIVLEMGAEEFQTFANAEEVFNGDAREGAQSDTAVNVARLPHSSR